MIKVTLRNIKELGLPLDNTSKILERGSSKEVLKHLEKKYGKESYKLCFRCANGGYTIYTPEYYYIPAEDKRKWVTNYEVYVRSSLVYKFWICFYKTKEKITKKTT